MRMGITAMILAGGLGTRLRSVVADRPKPMAPVNGKPFIELLIRSLAAKGMSHFVLLTGFMGKTIQAHFDRVNIPGARIACVQEPMPLGTGGAVKHAEHLATDPTLLVNGDTFFDADLEALHRMHTDQDADVTLSLRRVSDARRYGAVEVLPDGRITGFYEKEHAPEGPAPINAGVSLLSKDFIHQLPANEAFSMERDIFPDITRSGRMFGCIQNKIFFDIGTPDSYEAFQNFVLESGSNFS